MDKWEIENILIVLKSTCLTAQISKKDFYLLIRKTLTGTEKGPELFRIIYLFGKEEVLKHLKI